MKTEKIRWLLEDLGAAAKQGLMKMYRIPVLDKTSKEVDMLEKEMQEAEDEICQLHENLEQAQLKCESLSIQLHQAQDSTEELNQKLATLCKAVNTAIGWVVDEPCYISERGVHQAMPKKISNVIKKIRGILEENK